MATAASAIRAHHQKLGRKQVHQRADQGGGVGVYAAGRWFIRVFRIRQPLDPRPDLLSRGPGCSVHLVDQNLSKSVFGRGLSFIDF